MNNNNMPKKIKVYTEDNIEELDDEDYVEEEDDFFDDEDEDNEIIEEYPKSSHKSVTLKGRLILLGIGVGLLILSLILKSIPAVSEWYSKTIFKFFQAVFGGLTSWIPVSIFELSLIVFIISIILWIVFFIIDTKIKGIKRSYTRIIDLGIVISMIFSVFMFSCGINYGRGPIDLELHTQLVEDPKIYKDVGQFFLKDFVNCSLHLKFEESGSSSNPYDEEKLNSIMQNEYSKLSSDYYAGFTPNAKPLYLTSWLYTQMQISGITFGPLGEANYNKFTPAASIPITIAHELAHAKGVYREDDANLLAAYICLNSNDYYLRYSGYVTVFSSLAMLVKATNVEQDYIDFIKGVPEKIRRDMEYISLFWKSNNFFGSFAEFFNNLYLKLISRGGTDSYNDKIDIDERKEGDKTIYTIKSYSPYQALLLKIYFSLVNK